MILRSGFGQPVALLRFSRPLLLVSSDALLRKLYYYNTISGPESQPLFFVIVLVDILVGPCYNKTKQQKEGHMITYRYFLCNDADVFDKSHRQFFKTVDECRAYMDTHRLHITHLVYDLSTSACVNVFNSTDKKTVHL